MQNEIEIEVFRADTKASKGITAADLAHVAEFDCSAHPVGGVIGHPASDSPAVATVKKFRADGSTLFATVTNFKDALVNGIKNSEILNRSMAFFGPTDPSNPTPGKLAPRHLGFLGAAAPGIPGMSPLANAFQFSADDDLEIIGDPADAVITGPPPKPTGVVFMANEEPKSVELTPEQIAENERIEADRQALADERLAFAAEQKATREAGNSAIVAGLLANGRVTPAEVPGLTMVFNALNHEPLEFAAGEPKESPAARLAKILGSRAKVVPVGQDRISPTAEFGADDFDDDDDVQDVANSIDAKARAMMAKQPGLTFAAAVEKVAAQ